MYILLMKDGEDMNTQIKKIGNSKGVIIPAAILKVLDLKESEDLTIRIENNEIILSKVEVFDPKSLDELFVGYKGTYKTEIVFDDAKGKEVW